MLKEGVNRAHEIQDKVERMLQTYTGTTIETDLRELYEKAGQCKTEIRQSIDILRKRGVVNPDLI